MNYHQIKSRYTGHSLVDSFVKKIKIMEKKKLKNKENISKGRMLTFCAIFLWNQILKMSYL